MNFTDPVKSEPRPEPARTQDEVVFITKLGTLAFGTISQKVINTPRIVLLKRYLSSCKRRVDWDGIDKDQAVLTAKSMINSLGG